MHWFIFGAALPILSLSFALHMGDAAAMRQMIEPGVGESPIVMDAEQSEGILRLTAQTLNDILGMRATADPQICCKKIVRSP